MFTPKTERILDIANRKRAVIEQLESLIVGRAHVYIDYANVKPWANRLEWHIDLKRLRQFLCSFENVASLKFYYGTMVGDAESEKLIEDVKKLGYEVRTKPVKKINIPIDASSINRQSTALLQSFIRPPLLKRYDIATIEYLNDKFKEMNKLGVRYLQDLKCNFDVEMGTDVMLDKERSAAECFMLWTGDSDFHDVATNLLDAGKKVVVFATARTVSSELNELRAKGLFIFEVSKIRDFICWKRELPR